MTVNKFLDAYQGVVLEDAGSVKSQEFIKFASDMKRTVQSELKTIGAKLEKWNVGHYDVSGFITKNGKYVYFSYSESRHMPIDLTRSDPMKGILYRTATGPKDYTGGYNQFTNIMSFASSVEKLL